jgi:hypothetical protein
MSAFYSYTTTPSVSPIVIISTYSTSFTCTIFPSSLLYEPALTKKKKIYTGKSLGKSARLCKRVSLIPFKEGYRVNRQEWTVPNWKRTGSDPTPRRLDLPPNSIAKPAHVSTSIRWGIIREQNIYIPSNSNVLASPTTEGSIPSKICHY